MESNKLSLPKSTSDQEIDVKQIVEQYAYHWKWFLFSITIALVLAVLYIQNTAPQYKIEAKILLQNEDKASGDLAGLAELSSITGGGGASAFVLDQIDVFKSRRLANTVVVNKNLDRSYFVKNGLSTKEILDIESPVVLTFEDGNSVEVEHRFKVYSEVDYLLIEDLSDGSKFQAKYDVPVKTKAGLIRFVRGDVQSAYNKDAVEIVVSPINAAVEVLRKNIEIKPNTEKQSYIINFSMTDMLIKRSISIIDELISTYNSDVFSDKRKVTSATSKFINQRLTLIGEDLSKADQRVEDFKTSNKLTDLSAEVEVNLRDLTEIDRQVLDARTQVQLIDYMRESVANNDELQLLPSNIGLKDLSIEKSIVEYNRLVLEREDLLRSSTEDNPVVKNITNSIEEFNRNLNRSLANYRSTLQLSLRNIEARQGEVRGRMSGVPQQESGFKDIARQQQTVEAIYLFLLQKREENEIKAAARPDILKVIDSAYNSANPVAPKKAIILLGALIVGVLIPFGILYLKFLLDNKVQSRKDIEDLVGAPVLGELPSAKDPIVHNNDRSPLAEAFRILRTNMSFMLGGKKDSTVIYVTSTTSGEGKSFVSTNLARILSMSGKGVLLIGADIRSPKVLDYLGLSHLQHTNVGITQFLINPDMDVNNIIIKKPEDYDFDIIYSGYVAPNPAELLMNGHFEDVINYAKEHYDYILVDTAPVSLVTDTLLIAENADLTLYVSRANYLDKRLLNVPRELYQDGKLKNMAFVINDVDFARGYGYGYGYGYGESGNRSVFSKIKHWLKNFFKKTKI